MKKIRLRLERLDVESFETTRAGDGAGGTVLGHAAASADCPLTDNNTCGSSCWYQCRPTLDPSCNC